MTHDEKAMEAAIEAVGAVEDHGTPLETVLPRDLTTRIARAAITAYQAEASKERVSAAHKIIMAARDIQEGNLASVHFNGQTWRPEPAWQPIETAPKDGTRILIWFSYSAEGQARARVPGREEAGRWSVNCGAWMLDHDAFDEGHAPTHWQPLPNPPASP